MPHTQPIKPVVLKAQRLEVLRHRIESGYMPSKADVAAILGHALACQNIVVKVCERKFAMSDESRAQKEKTRLRAVAHTWMDALAWVRGHTTHEIDVQVEALREFLAATQEPWSD